MFHKWHLFLLGKATTMHDYMEHSCNQPVSWGWDDEKEQNRSRSSVWRQECFSTQWNSLANTPEMNENLIRITWKCSNVALQKKLHSSKSTLCFTIYGPSFKGTVPQDFRLQVFLISFPQSPPLVPYMMFSKPREDISRQFINDTGRKLTKTIIDTGGNLITGRCHWHRYHQYQQ